MAKLNWHKLAEDKKLHSGKTSNLYKANPQGNFLWPYGTKYRKHMVSGLPQEYLEWVGMNFDTSSHGYQVALRELERRTSVAQKVGRPDHNTAGDQGL